MAGTQSRLNFLPENQTALMTGLLGGLIFMQPDLGTAFIVIFIFFVFVVAIELNPKTLWRLIGTGVVLAPFTWFFLKDYQKTRILTLFNPELDPLKTGYHTIQSKIAVGSGGFWGKGQHDSGKPGNRPVSAGFCQQA